ncbi:hypothetical protein GIB67_031449 [Kingdonia uniflora]|uniref:Myb-like domain-containing protein n=1 Tax=Kingdonia uniflora TaxID=39325 RepID=A0A7J7MB66_9MAGN|nr:hypothetical protein GIB67_031449 [Kingdonia uniflora]
MASNSLELKKEHETMNTKSSGVAQPNYEQIEPISLPSPQNSTEDWTDELNKLFEEALNIYDKDTPKRWQKIAIHISGKKDEDVKKHYENLVRVESELLEILNDN